MLKIMIFRISQQLSVETMHVRVKNCDFWTQDMCYERGKVRPASYFFTCVMHDAGGSVSKQVFIVDHIHRVSVLSS